MHDGYGSPNRQGLGLGTVFHFPAIRGDGVHAKCYGKCHVANHRVRPNELAPACNGSSPKPKPMKTSSWMYVLFQSVLGVDANAKWGIPGVIH